LHQDESRRCCTRCSPHCCWVASPQSIADQARLRAGLRSQRSGWRTLSLRWGGFFLALAAAERSVCEELFPLRLVYFKVWAVIPLCFLFALAQTPLISRSTRSEPTPRNRPDAPSATSVGFAPRRAGTTPSQTGLSLHTSHLQCGKNIFGNGCTAGTSKTCRGAVHAIKV